MSAAKKASEPRVLGAEIIENSKWSDQVNVVDLVTGTNHSVDVDSVIGLCDSEAPDQILDIVLHKGLTQVVQTSAHAFEEEIKAAALMLTDSDSFLAHPISSILSPEVASEKEEQSQLLVSIDFARGAEKHSVLERIEDTLKGLIKAQSLITDILCVADELFTNAVFNAPFVNNKNAPDGVTRRPDKVAMDSGKSGRIFVGANKNRLVVGCEDPYGSLDVLPLFRRIRDCYKTGVADNIKSGNGGAGIGSFMVYHLSTSYYAAVKNGKATLICCTIPLKMSGRKRAEVSKNLHYFHVKESDNG